MLIKQMYMSDYKLNPYNKSAYKRISYNISAYKRVYLFLQGWIECIGCADRACFDLLQHTNASGEKLVAMVDLPEPVSFS